MNTARSIIAVLTRRERWMAAGLIVLMLIGMGFETLGIGLVMPALAFLVRDDSYTVFKRARALAWNQKAEVSYELLDTQAPIKFGLGGSRSLAQ